jgi:hypothetical protein
MSRPRSLALRSRDVEHGAEREDFPPQSLIIRRPAPPWRPIAGLSLLKFSSSHMFYLRFLDA